MKNYSYLLLFCILILLFPCISNAKIAENICVYMGNYQSNENSDKKTGVEVFCNFYSADDYECSLNLSSYNQNIGNYSSNFNTYPFSSSKLTPKEYYDQHNKCFPYMVFYDTGGLGNRYQIFAAETSKTADEIIKSINSSQTIKMSLDVVDTDIYDDLDIYIEKFTDLYHNYSGLNKCTIQNGKILPDYKVVLNFEILGVEVGYDCGKAIQDLYDDINYWNAKVSAMLKSGTFEDKNDILKRYNDAVEWARSQFGGSIDNYFIAHTIDIDTDKNTDVTPDEADCNSIFGGTFGDLLKQVLSFIRFVVPILIISLSIVDFIKALANQTQEELKKAFQRLVKRIIIGVVIFLLPTILEVILNLAGIETGTCGIR